MSNNTGRPMRGERRTMRASQDLFLSNLNFADDGDEEKERAHQEAPLARASAISLLHGGQITDEERQSKRGFWSPIANAVALVDVLCKGGLVQEAMKLFGLMRQKVPYDAIYIDVVVGIDKTAKFDDIRRIFGKMQKHGVVPIACSYKIPIQGLCRGWKLEDSVEFCTEMLGAGHSPNVMAFMGLVDGFCKRKGWGAGGVWWVVVKEAENVVKRLQEGDVLF
ncbi:hypothetical protein B296_00033475 [Ensete ventricosum]|uniref:Pentacotripeptide-repeat region of PRORP domain-containing protein n=1 Tax=Ensete ventricosum TaxID=4639 RepID=A0A427AAQ2_ENSVE|nr:hypothetical protein B296_00033475 [Ensete ventricosum]